MPRSRSVTEDDLDSKYLSELTGDDNTGGNNEDAGSGDEGSEGQDTSGQDGSGTRPQRGDDDGRQPGDRGRTAQEPGAQARRTGPANQQQARGNGQQQQQKTNLTDAAQKQVYMAIKDRLQPVFNAQNRQMNTLRQQHDTATAQLKVYQDRDQAAQHYKLTPVQQTQSYQMMAAFIKDPPATIKYLIDKATAGGHNVAAILGNGSNGPSPDAIKQMIADAVSPLTQEANTRREQVEQRNAAQEQLNTFYGEFPDAQIHEQTLNMAIRRDPSLSLHRALFELKDYYAKNGMDWTVPLHIHVQQRGQQQQQNVRQSQPLNMRGNNGQQFDQDDRAGGQQPREAAPSTSFKDIIREQMRIAGFNVQNL